MSKEKSVPPSTTDSWVYSRPTGEPKHKAEPGVFGEMLVKNLKKNLNEKANKKAKES